MYLIRVVPLTTSWFTHLVHAGYLNDHWHGRASDTMSLETLLSSEADWRFHSEVVSAIRFFSQTRYIAGIKSTRFVDKRERWRYIRLKYMLSYYESSRRVQSWYEDWTNYILNSMWMWTAILELHFSKCHENSVEMSWNDLWSIVMQDCIMSLFIRSQWFLHQCLFKNYKFRTCRNMVSLYFIQILRDK